MRYAMIDITLPDGFTFFDHDQSLDYLKKAKRREGIQVSVFSDGIKLFKYGRSLHSFFIPETHPLYNTYILYNFYAELFPAAKVIPGFVVRELKKKTKK